MRGDVRVYKCRDGDGNSGQWCDVAISSRMFIVLIRIVWAGINNVFNVKPFCRTPSPQVFFIDTVPSNTPISSHDFPHCPPPHVYNRSTVATRRDVDTHTHNARLNRNDVNRIWMCVRAHVLSILFSFFFFVVLSL